MKGRYHQSSACFHAVGNRVLTLHREKHGAIALGPDPWHPREYGPLTQVEIDPSSNTSAAPVSGLENQVIGLLTLSIFAPF